MINVECEVKSYDAQADNIVIVKNHWNDRDMVVIKIGDVKVQVKGSEMKAAIDNAMNTRRF